MDEVWHEGPRAHARLGELGLEMEELLESLKAAASDARMCTELDAPGAPAYTFWTRTNRYYRERLANKGWPYTNENQILRAIHPKRDFCLTAISGAGQIGVVGGKVHTKNPKGSAMAKLVRANGLQFGQWIPQTLPGLAPPSENPSLDSMPLWLWLYDCTSDAIRSEISLPVDMNGKNVDTFIEHIVLDKIPLDGPPVDLDIFNDGPDDDDLDVPVRLRAL